MKRILLFTMMCLFGLFSLNAQETSFSYNFDDGSLTGWRTFKSASAYAVGWQITPYVPSANYQQYYKGTDNSSCIVSISYDLYYSDTYKPDSYIVTDNAYQITATSKLSWNAKTPFSNAGEYYEVVISETGTDDSFVSVWSETLTNVSSLQAKEINLAELASDKVGKEVYIGFRHYRATSNSSATHICIDDIVLSAEEAGGEGGDEPGDVVETTVTIGEGTTIESFSPSNINYNFTVSQQIYLAEEFGDNVGNITSFAFKNAKNLQQNSNPYTATRTFKVYMMNTTKSSFSTNTDWVNIDEANLVYNGSVSFGTDGEWVKIEFDTPFTYESGSNVLLCINDVTGTFCPMTSNYYKKDTESARCIYAYRDEEPAYSVTALTSVTAKAQPQLYVPQAQFTFEATSTPEPESLPAPQNLVATTSTETSITLAWSPVEGATDYNVYYDKSEEEKLVFNTEGDTTYTANDLEPNTFYCFHVTAVNATGESDSTELCSATKELQLLPAPQEFVATEVTATSITLTWQPVEGAEGYIVYKNGELYNSVNEATYTEYGLLPETECCFEICAYDENYGAKTQEVCVTTDPFADNEILTAIPTDKGYYPLCTTIPGETVVEVIYRAEEIGRACKIEKLAFWYQDGKAEDAEVKIYLAETTKTAFAGNDAATDLSELTLVYSGEVTLNDEEWETFELSTPFNYSGENNLLLVVNTTNSNRRASNYRATTDEENTVLVMGNVLNKKPVMKLTWSEYEEPVDLLPYRLQSITGENTGNNPDLYYVYSEDESRVEKITEGSYATFVEYNTDGTVAKTSYFWVDPNSGNVEVSDGNTYYYTYTYENGVLTSYDYLLTRSWYPYDENETYGFSYNEDGTVAEITYNNGVKDCKYAYEYKDGKLVKASHLYYDEWAYPEPSFVAQYYRVFEYDENGNCVTETQYNAEQNPPTAQSGVDYFYDLNVDADSVYAFTYPHEVLPTNANLLTKAVSYSYNREYDYETGTMSDEATKGNFSVKTYNYNKEVVNAPVAPINLAAKVLSDTKVELTWETLEEVESFKVYNGTTLVEEGIDTVYYLVEGLEPLTEYTFTVVAVNGELESAASEEAKVTTYNLVNAVPNEVAFGNVVVGDYWSEKSSIVSIEINRFGKDVKQIKTDNSFFRVPASITLTDDPIKLTVNYKKNAEAGEYEGNLLVILASDDTVSFPLSATAYTPVTPDVFELAQAIETVDGLFVDRPDFATLADDYKLPGEDEDGNRPDAVYSFTLAEEASVEIDVEGSWDAIYAIYKAPFEGNGPSTDNNVEPTEKVLSTTFACDFEDGSLEDFEIQDTVWKVKNNALVYSGGDYTYNSTLTKNAYNITEKSVLTFDAQFLDVEGKGAYKSFEISVTKDGENLTWIGTCASIYDPSIGEYGGYSAEFESYRVDLGAKFAEMELEYGEYRLVWQYVSYSAGVTSIDNIELSERAWVYPAGDYYLVAAASSDFKVTVKSDALPELELNKEAHYRLVSREIDYAYERYNYASKIGTKVVNVNNSGDLDFLKYNDEGLLLGFVTCNMDENGGISDTLGVVEYIYEDSALVGYREESVFMGQVQEKEYVFHYNADGRIDTVRCEANNEVRGYTYNEEGLLVEIIGAYDYDGEFSYDYKQVYTYENGNLVKEEVLFYNWEAVAADTLHILPLDSLFSLSDETVYEYDSLGNVISAKIYGFYPDGDSLVKYLYEVADYVYDYNVSIENVFYFEYPHYAYEYLLSPVKPSHANIILAENRLNYDSYNNEYHTPRTFTYRYEEYELESEDAPVAPATPENFVATATSDSTIVLTWNAVEGATGYNVYQGTETLKEGLTDTTYTVTGLAAATTYTFEVVAVNGELVSNRASATAKTLDATPDTPVAPAAPVVKAEATSDTTIVLTWNKVEGALTYNVYQGTDTVAIATALTDTTYVVKGLTANTEYTFGVTAVNEAGESARGEAKAKTEGQGLAELNATVEIYPNPAVDRLVIETDSYVEEVSIYAITGTLIYREVDFNSNTIDVSTFDGGVYIMKVRTENGEVVKRFVKK